jgi:hypothetical protein
VDSDSDLERLALGGEPTSGPPFSPSKWTLIDRFLEPSTNDQIWGFRITPRNIIEFDDIYGLIYSSNNGRGGVTSIMFSEDKIRWVSSPTNPLFSELRQAWQGTRAVGEALVYDDANERWILCITGTGADYMPGLRGQGLVYSEDLVTWEFEEENPVITSENVDWIDGTTDRVYVRGLKKHEGSWYAWIQANQKNDDGQMYNIGILKSEDLINWRSIEANPVLEVGKDGDWDERQILIGSPTLFNGVWYIAYTNQARNQVGFAYSKSIEEKWKKSEENPILDLRPTVFEGAETPFLTPIGSGWGIIMGVWKRGVSRKHAKLGMATNHPSIIRSIVR